MSELVLHKKARQLCVGEGKSWSLKDFENGVPGVTMLTGCRRREETARVSEPSESDA
jgi:3'-phosphoadenosine 5'-phosphosulfate sulfotransferase (PAPS reductase)/FAD synthetase